MKKIIVILLLIISISVNATTYYVATTGNNGNAGTSASPWLTVQKGADMARAGDTVIVKSGTYNTATWSADFLYSGSAGNPIVFMSEVEHGGILDGQNAANYCMAFTGGVSYITIIGFDIRNFTLVGITSNNPANPISYIIISKCNIHDIGRYCTDTGYGLDAMFFNGISNITIKNNVISDIGRYAPGEGGCTPVNEYYKNHDHGIYMISASDVIIENNIFYNCNRGWAIHFTNAPYNNIKIYNNTFDFGNLWDSSGGYGSHIILGDGVVEDVDIANNIFNGCYDHAIWLYYGTYTNVLIRNNLVHGGDGDVLYALEDGVTLSNNFTNTEPLMTDRDNYEFTLTSSSPAIDAGTSVGVPKDYNGNTRDGFPDIGALEFIGDMKYLYKGGKTIFKGNKIITK